MPAVDRDHRYVLAVDLGTGGPKVGLVSLTGALVWSEHQPTSTRHGAGGAVTQDADEWWRLISSASRRAVRSGVVPVERIVAVSCTGQWSSTVPVDADGLPVGDCLMWLDTQGADMVRRAVGGPIGGYSPIALARWILHSGGAPSTSGADPIGHILFIEHSRPDVARSTRWYLEPVDYLSMRFTGIAAASPASMAGAWLTDNRHPEQLRYDPVLVKASGVPGWKLPPLVPTLSVLGEVRPAGGPGSRARARGGRGRGHTGSALGGRRIRRGPGPPTPPGHLHDELGQLPVPEEEDRPHPPDGHRSGCSPRPQPGGQQPGVGGRRARVVAGLPERAGPTLLVRAVDRPRRAGRAGQRGRHLHPLAGRRAVTRRRPLRPGEGSTTCRCGRHGPRWYVR